MEYSDKTSSCRPTRNNIIILFSGVKSISEEEELDFAEDSGDENERWISDDYKCNQIVTIQYEYDQLNCNNNPV